MKQKSNEYCEDLIPQISINGYKSGKNVRTKVCPIQTNNLVKASLKPHNNNSIAYKDMNGSSQTNGQKVSQNESLKIDDNLQRNGKIHKSNGTSNASLTNDFVTSSSTFNASPAILLLKSCGKSLR